jgi:hypothetical protein
MMKRVLKVSAEAFNFAVTRCMACLPSSSQILKVLKALAAVIPFVDAVVWHFNPLLAVWIFWGWLAVGVITGGFQLYLWYPSYVAGIVAAGLFLLLVSEQYVEHVTGWLLCSPPSTEDVLVPSALPSPPNPCPPDDQKNELFVFLGTNAGAARLGARTIVIGTNASATLPASSLLSITRDSRGVSISADIFDKDGVNLATIKDNHPYALSNVCVRRPDLSTFVVEDFHRTELLFGRYLNPLAIEVRGRFAYPEHDIVTVSKTSIRGSFENIYNNCMIPKPGAGIFQMGLVPQMIN